MTRPPRSRQMLASWFVAFPTITAILIIFEPVIAAWPLLARTFVLTLLMVPIMNLLTPLVAARVAWPGGDSTKTTPQEKGRTHA